MIKQFKMNNPLFLPIVGLAGWVLPGAGYLLLNDRKKAIIIFVTITRILYKKKSFYIQIIVLHI